MMHRVPEPLNAQEKYLHGINVRLEVLIDQVSSLIQHIADKEGVAVESARVEDDVAAQVAPAPAGRRNRKG